MLPKYRTLTPASKVKKTKTVAFSAHYHRFLSAIQTFGGRIHTILRPIFHSFGTIGSLIDFIQRGLYNDGQTEPIRTSYQFRLINALGIGSPANRLNDRWIENRVVPDVDCSMTKRAIISINPVGPIVA